MNNNSAAPPLGEEDTEAPLTNVGDRGSSSGAAAGEGATSKEEQLGATGEQGNHAGIDNMDNNSAAPPLGEEDTEAPLTNVGDRGSSGGAAEGEGAEYEQTTHTTDRFDRFFNNARKSPGVDGGRGDDDGDDLLISKKVLVFGSAGTGKTSFVNALTRGILRTGDGAKGVTFGSSEIFLEHGGVNYSLIDTVGLNEADEGTVSDEDAVKGLVQLLERTEGGINLMIMVVKKGRIHESTLNNYRLFVEKMTFRDVPLVVVVTHCERETGDMQGWVDANREDFLSRGIEGAEFVATTFGTPDPEIDNVEAMKKKIALSVDLSWRAIEKHSTPKRVDFIKLNHGIRGLARRMYKSLTRHVGAGAEGVSNARGNTSQRVDNVDNREDNVEKEKEPNPREKTRTVS